MKGKKSLLLIIGGCITVAFLLAINILFMVKEEKTEILLSRTSNLIEKFENEEVTIIPDSETNHYIIEERDNKTTEELNKENNTSKSYNKTEFSYNINNEKIEIVNYKGNENDIIIPTKIDNMEVKKVNLSELSKKAKTIYIPDTISDVEGKISPIYTNKNVIVTLNILALISLVIYIVAIATLSNNNLEENFYNSTTYIFSIIYLVGELILCFINRSINIIPKSFYVIYLSITLIYILLMIALRFYKYKLLNSNK